jgi:DNA-binding PadR family transcriptional regulator
MNTTVSPLAYHILLSLAQGPQHGYVLMKMIAEESGQRHRPGPATLYHTLTKLADQGWVQEVPPPADNQDPRRKYYSVTTTGHRILREESAALMEVAQRAASRLGGLKA